MSEDFEDGKAVANVEYTRRLAIRQWLGDDNIVRYDWMDDSGDESFELFDSVEDARRDALRSVGG